MYFNLRGPRLDRRGRVELFHIVCGVVFGIPLACLLFGFLFPTHTGHRPSGKTRTAATMGEVLKAMRLYDVDHDRMPPAVFTKNGHKHSWRVLLLPYLGHGDIYDQYRFDEAWNSPHNAQLTSKPLLIYQSSHRDGDVKQPTTNFVVVVGPETAFPPDENVAISMTGIPDGSTTTIALVEIADSDIHWAEPRDLEFSKLDFTINGPKPGGISRSENGGAYVGLAGCNVRVSAY